MEIQLCRGKALPCPLYLLGFPPATARYFKTGGSSLYPDSLARSFPKSKQMYLPKSPFRRMLFIRLVSCLMRIVIRLPAAAPGLTSLLIMMVIQLPVNW